MQECVFIYMLSNRSKFASEDETLCDERKYDPLSKNSVSAF